MVLKLKKRRHKPLYKNFIPLKKNIQNRRRLNLLKFKKQKWEKLISYIKRLQLRRKKNFRMYDTNRFFLPKFYNSFKRKHKLILQAKKKFKLFYGGLLEKHLRKYTKTALKQRNKCMKKFVNFNSSFLNLFEQRLDIVIYRSHFALSVRLARQLISHKHVKVNNNVVNKNSYILKKGDLIEVLPSGHEIVCSSVKNSHLWPISPKYININYKTLQIVFNDSIECPNFSIYFPFWIDLYTVIRYSK